MTEELWYPEFGLIDNPFQFYDFYHEQAEDVPLIETEEVNRIKSMRGACYIAGDKGVGKSTVLYMTDKELRKRNGTAVFSVIAPTSLTGFYDELFFDLCHFYAKKKQLDWFFQANVNMDWFEIHTGRRDGKEFLDTIRCHYGWCKLYQRCKIRFDEPSDSIHRALNMDNLRQALRKVEKYCTLKADLVQRLVANLPNIEDESRFMFLFDFPDDFYKGFDDFKEVVIRMRHVGSAVVIMTTRRQYEKLAESDYFGRIQKFEFSQMTNEELKQLYRARIKWQQESGNYPPLLTDEALDYVVKKSIRNPRTLLQICNEVVSSMQAQHKTSSSDIAFVEVKSKTAGALSMDDYIRMLVLKYKEQRKRWVPVQQSVVDMKEWFNVEISEKSLGRKLMTLHRQGVIPDQHYTPDSEYLYYMGTLDADG